MADEYRFLEDSVVDTPIVATERVFTGAVFTLDRETFDYNGTELTREYVGHPGAVAVVAVDEDERIAVIKQYRHPVRRQMWEIPAGLRDVVGEDPLEAAKRELAEEVDLTADNWQPLVSFNNSPGGSSELLHVFLATGLHTTETAFERVAEESDMEIGWAHVDVVLDAILARRVGNPSLIIGVLAYAATRGRR